ncbi:heterokaryon incompatibility protein-domain-containing protein, partial [Pyrenochaeta sp. MPI-SDFR-AT-0127]
MQFDCVVCRHPSDQKQSISLASLEEQLHLCQTCTLLWNGVTAVLGSSFRDVMTDVDISERAAGEDGPLIIHVRHHQVFSRTIQFYRSKDSSVPWPEIGIGSDVGTSGLSGSTIQRAKQWIEACTSCQNPHSGCKPYGDNARPLPKRVIDVGVCDQDPLSLHVSQDIETGRYVALSHCWGSKANPTLTTTENYEGYIKEIPLPLSKTFMDAIHVVRALGVRYLWIDSVCIIQDSPKDWSEQAPQMATIYGNAYCTISA